MRICIYGAGAIGGYLGVQLALAGANVTLIARGAHLAAMQANLARCCRVEPEAINIKATTTEKMGYTGRGEGISAHAVVLLKESVWK